jgi:signal recognition particle GTPase
MMKQFEQMSKMMKMMQGQEEKPHEDDGRNERMPGGGAMR